MMSKGECPMHDRLFEAALGIAAPWFVGAVRFDEPTKVLTVQIDFKAGTRFGVEGAVGERPVHDTITKRYRHLNFFQHECVLEVRTPRVKLPDGSERQVKPPFSGKRRCGQPGGRDHSSRTARVDDEPATTVAQAPPGDRTGDRAPEDGPPDEPMLVGRKPGRLAAYGAVCGRLQPALAAAGDRCRAYQAAFFRPLFGDVAGDVHRVSAVVVIEEAISEPNRVGAVRFAMAAGRCGGGLNFAGPTTYAIFRV